MENKTSYPVKKSFCISGPNKLRAIVAFLFLIGALSTQAQTYTACFTMSTNQTCPGQAVTFTDCSGSIAGIMNTDDGATIIQLDAAVPSNTHIYNTPGVYHPFQVVNNGASGNSTSPTQTVTVVDNTTSPTFTLANCAGNQVTVNITDAHYDSYTVDWGDATSSTATPMGSSTHTYGASGTYNITVTGTFASATCVSTPVSLSVTTLNALIAPVIQDLTVNTQQLNGSVTLRFFALPSQSYQIVEQQGGGAPVNRNTVQFQNGLQSFTYSNVPTSVDPIYYRIYAYDDCGSPAAYSSDVYSAVLTGTATNNQNNISWEDYHAVLTSNFDHYDLYRDGVLLQANMTTNTYTDLAVTCQTTYQYQVITYTTTGEIAYSAFIPVTAISTAVPTIIQNPNVTVVNGQTLLVWDYPTGGFTPTSFTVQRSDNGGTYNVIGTAPAAASQYFDYGSSPGSSNMCYQVTYTDGCNNNAPYSVLTCPVLLQLSTSTTDNTLTWNSYTGYYATGLAGYEVEILDASGTIIQSIPVGGSLIYLDPINPTASTTRYRIKIISNGTENIVSYSNIVEVSFAPQLHVPTAFTPNADGQNDKFMVKGRYINDFEMTIFNQWGQPIFVSKDPNVGWDGTFNGEFCIVDDYAWLVKAKDNNGEVVQEKGTVSLIR